MRSIKESPAGSGYLWNTASLKKGFPLTASYRQLLVHLDSTRGSGARLAMARRLADQQGANLAALYAVAPAVTLLPAVPAFGPGLDSPVAADDERRRRARAAFDLVTRAPGPDVRWSEAGDVPALSAFLQQAFYADLLVLGQHEPESQQGFDVPADFPETVMTATGKPAIVVPYTNMPAAFGETVVIAWKETREAARAVTGALPLLQRARAVHVLTWNRPVCGVEGKRLDLVGYLALHGVKAVWHDQGQEPAFLGEILLSLAFDLEADLLVMGCYGHSRAREWVLGGASRTILRSMTVPVLMAH